MRRVLVTALLAVLLPVSGCAGHPASSPPAAANRPEPAVGTSTSGIDVLFLTMMVAHTGQTLEIVRLGLDRATNPEIRTLIAAVQATETDELATMRGWLREAGPSARAAAARHDHSGHSDVVAGLARLRAAPPAEVDEVLLDVLATHQRTAADLARAQVQAGTDARVCELAGRVERSRTAEIGLMTKLRAG